MVLSGRAWRGALVAALVAAVACAAKESNNSDAGTPDGGADGGSDGGGNAALSGPSRGSAVALTSDDTRAVMVNRDSGSVSVFSVEYPADGKPPVVTRVAEVAVGGEPWQVVVHPNDNQAFVVLRKDQKLVRIDDLKGTPKKGPEVAVGSEATGVALTPTGKTAWVANSVDGTLSGVDTATMKVDKTVDLNAALAKTGLLGNVAARPALAHPRSLAITNNGDTVESNEAIYVTELFAQVKKPIDADTLNINTSKVGIVYKVPLDTLEPVAIELPPLPKLGFGDANGSDTGCYPNLLDNITIQGGFGYVSAVCAAPRGPIAPVTGAACGADSDCPHSGTCIATQCTTCASDADCGSNGGKCDATSHKCTLPNFENFRAISATTISVIDLGGNKTVGTESLTRAFWTYYGDKGVKDDDSRRLPLNVTDIAFVPGTLTAYLASQATDALFPVQMNAEYKVKTVDAVGTDTKAFIDTVPGAVDPSRIGRAPTGVMITNLPHPATSSTRYAFVAADISRNLVVVDLAKQAIAGLEIGKPVVAESAAVPTAGAEKDIWLGKRFYLNGLGRWSLNGQGWGSCQTCHYDGSGDNVAWYAPNGPRQSSNLDGTFNSKDPTDQRLHMWSGEVDELPDHEVLGIRGAIGGAGAIVKDPGTSFASSMDLAGNDNLNGSTWSLVEKSAVDDWKMLDAYVKALRSPRRPSNLDAAKVTTGKQLFQDANCQGCHGGGKWTVSQLFYTPDATNAVNSALLSKSWKTDATNAGFPESVWPKSAMFPDLTTMRWQGPPTLPGLYFINDHLVCSLRNVGTYGIAEEAVGVGGKIPELRPSMAAAPPALGDGGLFPSGYNPPSLLSANVGAPYLHAGQVRTLEVLFSDAYKAHHQALKAGFLDANDPERAAKVDALVQFVLSIDEDEPAMPIPALGPQGGILCKN